MTFHQKRPPNLPKISKSIQNPTCLIDVLPFFIVKPPWFGAICPDPLRRSNTLRLPRPERRLQRRAALAFEAAAPRRKLQQGVLLAPQKFWVFIWLMMVNNYLVAGIPTPLKNDGVNVSWDDDIPNWMESHKIPWFPNHVFIGNDPLL